MLLEYNQTQSFKFPYCYLSFLIVSLFWEDPLKFEYTRNYFLFSKSNNNHAFNSQLNSSYSIITELTGLKILPIHLSRNLKLSPACTDGDLLGLSANFVSNIKQI